VQQRDASGGRIIEDHQTIGHAAALASIGAQSRALCKTPTHTTASEGARLELQRVRIARNEIHFDDLRGPRGDVLRQERFGGVDRGDVGAPRASAMAGAESVPTSRMSARDARSCWPRTRCCSAATIEPIGPRKRRSSNARAGQEFGSIERVWEQLRHLRRDFRTNRSTVARSHC